MDEPPLYELLEMEHDIDQEHISKSKSLSTGDLPFFARNDPIQQPSREILEHLDDLFGYNPLLSPLRDAPSRVNLDDADAALLQRFNDL